MLLVIYCNGHHPHLHSFPTRRSSDLCDSESSLRRPDQQAQPLDRTELLIAQSGTLQGRELEQHRDTVGIDRKSTRLNSSHLGISYAVFCLKKKKKKKYITEHNTLKQT